MQEAKARLQEIQETMRKLLWEAKRIVKKHGTEEQYDEAYDSWFSPIDDALDEEIGQSLDERHVPIRDEL